MTMLRFTILKTIIMSTNVEKAEPEVSLHINENMEYSQRNDIEDGPFVVWRIKSKPVIT